MTDKDKVNAGGGLLPNLISLIFAILFFFPAANAKAQHPSEKRNTNIAVGINRRTDDSSRISKLNIGLLCNTDSLRGFQGGLLTSVVMRGMHGMNFGGILSFTGNDACGLQIAGTLNSVGGRMRGMQFSSVSNIAGTLNGLQLSGFSNISVYPMTGMQAGVISNISQGVKRGVQLSGIANISSSYMRGVQIGGYNYTDTLSGLQLGIVNMCISHQRGCQTGIFNYSRDTVAHKIGLININRSSQLDLLFFAGTSSKFNLGLRVCNNNYYSVIGFGTHYMGLDKKFSGALFYRLGHFFEISPRFSLSSDIGYYHIETFIENSAQIPDRLFSLQLRVNADYRISRYFGVFASAGYGDTRYYSLSKEYRNRAIVEAGISMRYTNNANTSDLSYQNKKNEIRRDFSSAISPDEDSGIFYNLMAQPKHFWTAAAEVTGINLAVHCFDRFILNEEFAQVDMHTIHKNLKNGFVWDNDKFSTNLFDHPYHGSMYYNSARSNGFTFWESAPFALAGSLMWETCGEIEPPAINDLMATTLGGICIGEVSHRISDLFLNDSLSGFRRFIREFAATVFCPIKGLNRIITGKAWKVKEKNYKYFDEKRFPADFSVTLGNRYLADNGALFRGEQNPYFNLSLEYGSPFNKKENKPYDFFSMEATFGFSANQPLINGFHILGRIWNLPVYNGNNMKAGFGIFQHFNYYDSKPVKDGSPLTPYRISEAAALGPGMIFSFTDKGYLSRLEQRIFLSIILLGGTKSDYYNVIDRDYNLGSGYSIKSRTIMEFHSFGRFILHADYYRLYTWKGYEGKDLTHIDPLYLNVQGDKSNADLLVVNPIWEFRLSEQLGIAISNAYFIRKTRYNYHEDIKAKTFELNLGLTYHF